jgi:hypothetical protein
MGILGVDNVRLTELKSLFNKLQVVICYNFILSDFLLQLHRFIAHSTAGGQISSTFPRVCPPALWNAEPNPPGCFLSALGGLHQDLGTSLRKKSLNSG